MSTKEKLLIGGTIALAVALAAGGAFAWYKCSEIENNSEPEATPDVDPDEVGYEVELD